MSATTKFNWTDATWNPVSGCTPAGVGCAHCYAARMAERFPAVHGVEFSSESLTSTATCPVPFSTVICHPERLTIPEHWRKPRAIMCPSMGDLFHSDVPVGFIRDVLGVMDRCLQHTFIVLTKRPERARDVLGNWTKVDNMVLGVSVSTQAEADHAIPILLDTPAHRRIVSLEPLVGPVEMEKFMPIECTLCAPSECEEVGRLYCRHTGGTSQTLDGVIVGGESGPGARPMHPDWVRGLRDQCAAAGVPFFFKQWGDSAARDAGDRLADLGVAGWNREKKHGGRVLDGRTHDELCWDVRGKGEA